MLHSGIQLIGSPKEITKVGLEGPIALIAFNVPRHACTGLLSSSKRNSTHASRQVIRIIRTSYYMLGKHSNQVLNARIPTKNMAT